MLVIINKYLQFRKYNQLKIIKMQIVLPDPVFPITFILHPNDFGIKSFTISFLSFLIHSMSGNLYDLTLLIFSFYCLFFVFTNFFKY